MTKGQPLLEKIVTVTGDGANEPKNMLVRIGTSFADVIKAAGGIKEETAQVVAGGPMMGKAVGSLDVPVVKGTNAILCLTKVSEAAAEPTCIRCGKCVEVCPMNLQPLYLYRYGPRRGQGDARRVLSQRLHGVRLLRLHLPGQAPADGDLVKAKHMLKKGGK